MFTHSIHTLIAIRVVIRIGITITNTIANIFANRIVIYYFRITIGYDTTFYSQIFHLRNPKSSIFWIKESSTKLQKWNSDSSNTTAYTAYSLVSKLVLLPLKLAVCYLSAVVLHLALGWIEFRKHLRKYRRSSWAFESATNFSRAKSRWIFVVQHLQTTVIKNLHNHMTSSSFTKRRSFVLYQWNL